MMYNGISIQDEVKGKLYVGNYEGLKQGTRVRVTWIDMYGFTGRNNHPPKGEETGRENILVGKTGRIMGLNRVNIIEGNHGTTALKFYFVRFGDKVYNLYTPDEIKVV